MSEPFSNLGDVVADDSFPAVDLALRRGRHVHKGDERWYAFLSDGQALLEDFYRRYGYELLHRSDGYFFLLPASEGLGKRALSVAEMIVGQGLALAYLDPRTLEKGAVITREELINQLASAMGTDALLGALNPKRKRPDERVLQRTARLRVAEAVRRLGQLGFVELLEGEQLRLTPSLLRFAEPVRDAEAPEEAMRQLIARGEVSLRSEEAEAEPDENDTEEDDAAVEIEADAEPHATEAGSDPEMLVEDEQELDAAHAEADAAPEPSLPADFLGDDFWSDPPAAAADAADADADAEEA